MMYRRILTIPVLVVAFGISIISHMPRPPAPDIGFEFQDKVLHVLAYCVFGACFYLALYARWPALSFGRSVLFVLLASALFGIYDELHQSVVPNRDANIADWFADCLGGALALAFMPSMRRVARYVKSLLGENAANGHKHRKK